MSNLDQPSFPTLRTERLILRPWDAADLEPFAALNADPRVMEFFPNLLDRAESDALATRVQDHFVRHGYGLWAVEIPGVARFAGYVGLSVPTFWAHFTPCVEIGWRLARQYWGHGYASEGARAALAFAFNDLALTEVVSFTSRRNTRSTLVMERIGMKREPADDFEHPLLPEGHALRSHVLYRLSSEQWKTHSGSAGVGSHHPPSKSGDHLPALPATEDGKQGRRSPPPETEVLFLRQELARKEEELDDLRFKLSQAHILLFKKEQVMNRMTRSLGWRVLSFYGPIKYGFVKPVLAWLAGLFKPKPRPKPSLERCYQDWARMCESYRYRPERAAAEIKEFSICPVISIVMPTFNTPRELLVKAIESVRAQYYERWELCICDDASAEPHVVELLREYSDNDPRIKVLLSEEGRGIAQTSNAALGLATGEFVGFLDHDDELTPDALLEVVRALQQTDADLIYSDEDKLDVTGERCDPFAKPAWSPDLFLSTNYLCHFSVYRREILERIGGLRAGFEGSQDYDLALRFTEQTEKIIHIPKILYHWRKAAGSAAATAQAKPYAFESAAKALNEAFRRRGIEGEVVPANAPGYFRARRRIVRPGKVSIIIPTRDKLDLLRRCIDSIEQKTDYRDYEIIIVDNGSKQSDTREYLRRSPHKVIRDDGAFNFSRLNNMAAAQARGEYLLMLNNDTEVIVPEWLSAMVEHAQRPEVGAVGAKLLYPNGTIQHAGVIMGVGGVGAHSHKGLVGQPGGCYFNFPNIIANYSAVTGACLMIRKELFTRIEGFNEPSLAVSFNDVDLCLRLRKMGLLVVFTPYALLYHYESASRSKRVDMLENTYMLDKWGAEIARDPYYSPNLATTSEDYPLDYSKPEGFYCFLLQDLSEGLSIRLRHGTTVGQYFTAVNENLCGISVKFGTFERRYDGKITLRIRESHRGFDHLTSSTVQGILIEDNGYCMFPIDPVRTVPGKEIYFDLEAPDGRGKDAPAIWSSSAGDSILGPHYENHKPAAGVLCFGAYSMISFRVPNQVGGQVQAARSKS
jgi:GT2 family glycosyltransferase/RimJ/RimL family protein N-acetyltransferase